MTGKRRTRKKAEEEVKPLMVSEASESLASSTTSSTTPTRRNVSGNITRTDRYKNISDGLIPYKFTPGAASNRSNIDVRDAVILCQKAYYNFAVFRNVIDLMTEFSATNLYFTGGSKKSRDFLDALFKKIDIQSFLDKFFREYYRSGNVFIHSASFRRIASFNACGNKTSPLVPSGEPSSAVVLDTASYRLIS